MKSPLRRVYLFALFIAIILILFITNASGDTTTTGPELRHGEKGNITVTCVNTGTIPQEITIDFAVTGTYSGASENQKVDPKQVLTPSTSVSLGQLGVGQKQSKDFTVNIPTWDAAPNFAYSGLAITFECHGTQYGNPVGDVFSRTTVKVAIAGDSSSSKSASGASSTQSGTTSAGPSLGQLAPPAILTTLAATALALTLRGSGNTGKNGISGS